MAVKPLSAFAFFLTLPHPCAQPVGPFPGVDLMAPPASAHYASTIVRKEEESVTDGGGEEGDRGLQGAGDCGFIEGELRTEFAPSGIGCSGDCTNGGTWTCALDLGRQCFTESCGGDYECIDVSDVFVDLCYRTERISDYRISVTSSPAAGGGAEITTSASSAALTVRYVFTAGVANYWKSFSYVRDQTDDTCTAAFDDTRCNSCEENCGTVGDVSINCTNIEAGAITTCESSFAIWNRVLLLGIPPPSATPSGAPSVSPVPSRSPTTSPAPAGPVLPAPPAAGTTTSGAFSLGVLATAGSHWAIGSTVLAALLL
jgi:hypothetical protein